MTSRPLMIGVLGAANIARGFATGCTSSSEVRVAAVASRGIAKAQAFAAETGIPRAHASYEMLLADPEIEAVYLPLPNSLHATWAIRAAEAGKHILCEKPLALNAVEARAMFYAAQRHNVILREGYPYMAQEHCRQLRRWLAHDEIGPVRLIQATFGVLFNDPANVRLDPKLGGGTLYDSGSYALSLVRIVTGRCAHRVHASVQLDANGIDRTTAATLEFDDGLLAQIGCSFGTAYHRHAIIAGARGVIETNYLNHPPVGGPVILRIRRGLNQTVPFEDVDVPGGDGFRKETEAFARLVRGDPSAWSGATLEETLDIMRMMDAIRASVASGRNELVKA